MTNEKMENLQKMNTVMGFGIAYLNGGGYDDEDNEFVDALLHSKLVDLPKVFDMLTVQVENLVKETPEEYKEKTFEDILNELKALL